jgi:DNA-binding NarL/FixJ family response regulator
MLQAAYEDKPPRSPSIAERLLACFKSKNAQRNPLAPRGRQILQLLAKSYAVAKVAEM